MSKSYSLHLQKDIEVAEADGRSILKDLATMEIVIAEYKKTLASLVSSLKEAYYDEQNPDDIAF